MSAIFGILAVVGGCVLLFMAFLIITIVISVLAQEKANYAGEHEGKTPLW